MKRVKKIFHPGHSHKAKHHEYQDDRHGGGGDIHFMKRHPMPDTSRTNTDSTKSSSLAAAAGSAGGPGTTLTPKSKKKGLKKALHKMNFVGRSRKRRASLAMDGRDKELLILNESERDWKELQQQRRWSVESSTILPPPQQEEDESEPVSPRKQRNRNHNNNYPQQHQQQQQLPERQITPTRLPPSSKDHRKKTTTNTPTTTRRKPAVQTPTNTNTRGMSESERVRPSRRTGGMDTSKTRKNNTHTKSTNRRRQSIATSDGRDSDHFPKGNNNNNTHNSAAEARRPVVFQGHLMETHLSQDELMDNHVTKIVKRLKSSGVLVIERKDSRGATAPVAHSPKKKNSRGNKSVNAKNKTYNPDMMMSQSSLPIMKQPQQQQTPKTPRRTPQQQPKTKARRHQSMSHVPMQNINTPTHNTTTKTPGTKVQRRMSNLSHDGTYGNYVTPTPNSGTRQQQQQQQRKKKAAPNHRRMSLSCDGSDDFVQNQQKQHHSNNHKNTSFTPKHMATMLAGETQEHPNSAPNAPNLRRYKSYSPNARNTAMTRRLPSRTKSEQEAFQQSFLVAPKSATPLENPTISADPPPDHGQRRHSMAATIPRPPLTKSPHPSARYQSRNSQNNSMDTSSNVTPQDDEDEEAGIPQYRRNNQHQKKKNVGMTGPSPTSVVMKPSVGALDSSGQDQEELIIEEEVVYEEEEEEEESYEEYEEEEEEQEEESADEEELLAVQEEEQQEMIEEANGSNRNFDFVQWDALAERLKREYEEKMAQKAINDYVDVTMHPSDGKQRKKFMRRNTLTCDGRERLPAENISVGSSTIDTIKVPKDGLADSSDSVVMARAFQKAKAWKERKVNNNKHASLSYIDFPGVSPKAVEMATETNRITRRRSMGPSMISSEQAAHMYFHNEQASPFPPKLPAKSKSFESAMSGSVNNTKLLGHTSDHDASESFEEDGPIWATDGKAPRRLPPSSICDSVQLMREKGHLHSSSAGLAKSQNITTKNAPPPPAASIVDSVQLMKERAKGKQNRRNSSDRLQATDEEPSRVNRSRLQSSKTNVDLDASIDIHMLQMNTSSAAPGSSRWM